MTIYRRDYRTERNLKRIRKKVEIIQDDDKKVSDIVVLNQCKFLYDLNHDYGIDIGDVRMAMLREKGFFSRIDFSTATRADYRNSQLKVGDNVSTLGWMNNRIYKSYNSPGKNREILTSEWMPEDRINHTAYFCNWIDSINSGFMNRTGYEPFVRYVQQARHWLENIGKFGDIKSEDEQRTFASEERKRYIDNTLYFMNKHLPLKEGNISTGGRKYTAWECQAVLLFLFDCGYNIELGKLRQMGATSTLGGAALKRLMFNRSYFIKFLTENTIKGEEIFEDKIKFPFRNMEDWLQPTVSNDRDRLLRFLYKEDKQSSGGADSKLVVEAPYVTAINGGSPNLVMIDEIGQIPILSKIMNEGRPTLFWVNPETGKLEMKRQLVSWGTGAEQTRGGGEMEREFKACMEAFKKRDFNYGIVPLFLDAFAKPGMTKEFYEREKEFYYSKNNEASRIQFHQHYPLQVDDMFLSSSETLWPIEKINENISKIDNLKEEDKCQYGYFEPEFDRSRPMPEGSDIPFAITGAKWMPSEDEDPRSTVCIFRHPDTENGQWVNRYYQGTDPIFTQSGHSLFSSSIWDAYVNTVSACMNYRIKNYQYCYLQSALMGMYYNPNTMELVEYNAGEPYIEWKIVKGMQRTIVPNSMLPPSLQTHTAMNLGIRKGASNSKFILNNTLEMLENYGENIFIKDFFLQLKTYTRKMTPSGKETYKVENAKFFYDDVIDSITYAYICAKCYGHLEPRCIGKGEARRSRLRYKYDGNFNLILAKEFVR